MAWPDEAAVKASFGKLNDDGLDGKITLAVNAAKNTIMANLAGYYDVSGFTASTPPLLYDLCLYAAYGHFAPRVHTGSKLSASDEAAKDARDYAETQLEKLAKGELLLVDSAGAIVPRRDHSTGHVSRRTDGSVFGPGDPDTWGVTLLTSGSEMI